MATYAKDPLARSFRVTPRLLVVGLVWAGGLLGGLFPALSLARLRVAAALRAG